jgi:protein-tyrosine phosphatase
MINE